MKLILRLFGNKTDFDRLFFMNESRSLSGENNRVVLALIVILFFTLLALGFAVGSIQNLDKKMSNPFTNWVNLEVSDEKMASRAKEISQRYSQDELKQSLHLKELRGWVKFNLEFYHQDFDPTVDPLDSLSYPTWGRTIESDDPLLAEVMKPENAVIAPPIDLDLDEMVDDFRIVITEDMADRLGYDLNNFEVSNIFMRDGRFAMVVEVVAVVKELPKYCDFICSPQMYNVKSAKDERGKQCGNFIDYPEEGDSNFSFLVKDDELGTYKTKARDFFNVVEKPSLRIIDPFNTGKNNYNILELNFAPVDRPTLDTVNLFVEELRAENIAISTFAAFQNGDHCLEISPEYYYYLSFNFEKLDNVRLLRKDLDDKYGIDVDMSLIESKENFALVSRLTLIISSILLAFGVLSIILFVNNLLKSHLFKVRPHLGTFKAFGLNNKFLTKLYCRIILAFLLLSIAISLVASIAVEFVEQAIQGEDSRFDIFDPWIAGAIAILILISLIVSLRTIRSILGDTPGNLIYER